MGETKDIEYNTQIIIPIILIVCLTNEPGFNANN